MEDFKVICLPDISNYEVSSMGEIRNKTTKQILKQQVDNYGYKIVTILSSSNRKKMIRPHRAVALTYILNPDNKKEVNHIDCDKFNNHVDNLEWSTSSENKQHHLHKVGYHGGSLPVKCKIISTRSGEEKTFKTCAEAARYLGSSKANIARALKNSNRTVFGYKIVQE